MKRILILLSVIALVAHKPAASRFVITSYGAVADSTVLQTAAIQKAIDAAAAEGGTVVIPKGVWLSGALFFKPGTRLCLEEGAVLKGSDNTWDYPDTQVHIEGVLQPYAAALVNAEGVDGFRIFGKGTIDGNGLTYWKAFWQRRRENPACTNLEVRRPRLVSVSNAKNIEIEGVKLHNAGYWTVHLYKCDGVHVKDVDIYAPMKPVHAPSSDGIDLDACRNVHIEGCSFATADDLIALKGGKGPWADTDPDNGINEHILIERCHFGHGPGVLVCGSECVGVKDVVLRDCTVDGTGRLLWLKMRPDTPQRYEDITIERVSGKVESVLFVKPWTQFFDLKGRKDIPMSYASNITFRDCNLEYKIKENVEEAPDQFKLENIYWQNLPRRDAEFLGPMQGENHKKKNYSYQGMDVHGRWIVSCQNQGIATIYRLSGKKFKPVGQFHLASFHKNNHANVVSFGVEKFSSKDPLPLVYVSQCHKKTVDGRKDLLYIERIAPDLKSSELVQTIFYDDVNKDFGYALQWVVDTENGFLYGYGNTINNSDPANRHRIIKFRLPKISEGAQVVLKPEDALENYLIEEVSDFRFNPIGQGLYIWNGKLYMPTGVGNAKNPSILYVWDLNARSMAEYDFSLSTTGELEDIGRRGRWFYIQGQDGIFRTRVF